MLAREIFENAIVKEEVEGTRGGSMESPVGEHNKLEEKISVKGQDELCTPSNSVLSRALFAGTGIQNGDIFLLLFSIVIHVVDMGLDINLACHYYSQGEKLYFVLTIFCTLIPALISTILLSLNTKHWRSFSEMPLCTRIIRISLMLLLLAPVLSYWDLLNSILKARRAKKHLDLNAQYQCYMTVLQQKIGTAILQIIECFLETAPQTVLQISILLIEQGNGSTITLMYQLLSIISSLVCIARSMVSYQRFTELLGNFEHIMSWSDCVMMFLGYFMIIASRILSISLLASQFPLWTAIAFAVHWLGGTIWYLVNEDFSHHSSPREYIINLFFSVFNGFLDIFAHVTHTDYERGTPYLYELVCFIENVIASIVWANGTESNVWYFLPVITGSVLFYIMGIIFRIFYCLYFHPTPTYKKRYTYSFFKCMLSQISLHH